MRCVRLSVVLDHSRFVGFPSSMMIFDFVSERMMGRQQVRMLFGHFL
jgi:hypothetical protein